jgi:hypothetical protein
MNAVAPKVSLHESIKRLIVCPECHSRFEIFADLLACTSEKCEFRGRIVDGVVSVLDGELSFFDDRHLLMQRSSETGAARNLGYEQQGKFLAPFLKPGSVVLDCGCGPMIPYDRPEEVILVGLDTSLDSLRWNEDADLRVHGSATRLPFADDSLDTVVCFYSVHHMTGETIDASRSRVRSAFREFGRVIKQDGNILIFEMSPAWPFSILEEIVWQPLRNVLGKSLDMYFWTGEALQRLGRDELPPNTFEHRRFHVPALTTFPIAFSLPWLKFPRALYPFHVEAYHWWL